MQIEFELEDVLDPGSGGAVGHNGRPAPPQRLSPSGASTFEQCPRRWRFRYVERLPEPPGEQAVAGTFAHRVLELLMQRPPVRRTTDEARRIARAVWPEISDSDDYTELALDPEQALEFRWRAWRAVEGLWHLEDPTAVEVESTEEHLSVTLGEVPFRGVVDRIEREPDGLVVSDYKSGRAPSPRFAPARLQQVLLYCAAVAVATGERPVRAKLLYLGQRVVATSADSEDVEGALEQLTGTWEAIGDACAADEFEPRPGPLCVQCAYAPHCSEGQAETARRAAERAAEDEYLLRIAG